MAAIMASPQQVNLLNPALLPVRQKFSARQLFIWIALATGALAAVGWWTSGQMSALRGEIAAEQARPRPQAEPGPTALQVASLEQSLKAVRAKLDARRAALDGLRRGMAGPGGGPAGVMRRLAETIPSTVWLQDVNVNAARIDLKANALEPSAVEGWLERLRAGGFLADRPASTLRLDRIDAAVAAPGAPTAYSVAVSATLASPFAEGGR